MTYSFFDYSCVTDKMSLCMDKIIENRLKPLKFNNSQYFSEAELKERREGNDDQRFWSLLSDIKRQVNFAIPEERKIQILDIACGECKEAKLLIKFFGNEYAKSDDGNASLIGVDIDQKRINRAIELNSDNQNAVFLCKDATKLDEYPEISVQADIIMIRSQQISASKRIWTEIFSQAIKKLTDNGIMIVTSVSDGEHQMLKDAIKNLPFQILLDETNPHSRISDGHGQDMKVLVVKALDKK